MALVYDLGMHRTEDTLYYLWQGHDVVAVEANPALSLLAHQSLKSYVASGRLRIISAAIGRERGVSEFWIPSRRTQWGSLDLKIAQREERVSQPLMVEVTTLEDIVEDHGRPDYLKIDIEGSDTVCLEALSDQIHPRFVSVESECLGPDEVIDEQSSLRSLALLAAAGYAEFQLVDQYTLSPVTWDNICPRYSGGSGRRQHLKERLGWRFPFGSSGPWGADLEDAWVSIEEASVLYLEARRRFFAHPSAVPFEFWCDWHAR